MNGKNSVAQRLLSRKFWAAVGAFVTFAAAGQWTEAMAVIIAFVGAEAVVDYRALGRAESVEVAATEARTEIATTETTAKAEVEAAKA